MTKEEYVDLFIGKILKCSDARFITEIYMNNGSYTNGQLNNDIRIMIEVEPEFRNTSLYDCIHDIEDGWYPFDLCISVEPDMVERGHGVILWKRDKENNKK